MKFGVIFFLLMLTIVVCQSERRPQFGQNSKKKNVKQKVSNLIGSLRNVKFSYDPNKNRRSQKRPTSTLIATSPQVALTRQRHWPDYQHLQHLQHHQHQHIRPNRDSQQQPFDPPAPQQLPLSPNPYNKPEPETPAPPQPTYSEPTTPPPPPPTYATAPPTPPPSYNEQPAPTDSSPPVTEPPPPPSPSPPRPVTYKFKLLDAITTSTEAAASEPVYPPNPAPVVPQPTYQQSPVPANPRPVYPQSPPRSEPAYAAREALPSQKPFDEKPVFPNTITKSIAEFASTIDKDTVGDISPFSYFQNAAFGTRVVYPLDEVAPVADEPAPPSPPAPEVYNPPVNVVNEVLPQNYQTDSLLASDPSTSTTVVPARFQFRVVSKDYSPYPPLATPPPPSPPSPQYPSVPEPAPLHSETPNSITSDEDDTNENGSLISYKWRQLDSTSDSQQNQPELYNSVAPANNVKEVENYDFFISSSPSQPPPVEESAPAGNSEAPLFYFKEIVEEPDNEVSDTVQDQPEPAAPAPVAPDQPYPPAPVAPVQPYPPPAPVVLAQPYSAPDAPPDAPPAPATPSPVYYKPLPPAESPAPPAESAPEPNPPAEEQGPSESEPTPSPVYYKYSDSSSNSDDSAPVAESQEPKQEDGEELAGFPSQNFINQDNFKIPEFFRTFLNTPPKWINMNNW